MNVSAVIVTRGDVDLSPVLDSLPRDWQKVIWDNSVREDLAVYGRYAAIEECEHDLIFVVDDDVVLDRKSVEMPAFTYMPGFVTANMPQHFRHDFYADHCLVGFGAIFHRDLPARAFARLGVFGDRTLQGGSFPSFDRELFDRTCDVVFTALTPRILVDLPYRDLPHAHADNRMWKQPEHTGERQRMLDLVRQVRDA